MIFGPVHFINFKLNSSSNIMLKKDEKTNERRRKIISFEC